MTISENLFMSILAMDSYHRGYLPGESGLSDDANNTNKVGNATVSFNIGNVSQALAEQAFEEGFYAVAYTLDVDSPGGLAGQAMVFYRST